LLDVADVVEPGLTRIRGMWSKWIQSFHIT
jgi:hypothetical protein